MLKAVLVPGWAFLLAVLPASAQDYSSAASDSLSSAGSFAGTVGVNAHVKGRSNPQRRAHDAQSGAKATCANKGRAAANLGRNHPNVRKLYALCARAGF